LHAKETYFLPFLQNPGQFIVPVYQRLYSWKRKQCEQLWDDIIKIASDESKTHFLGSIVYLKKTHNISMISEYHVIDGQQRLTTLSILLLAIYEKLKENPVEGITSEQLKNYYLINKDEPEKYFKLLLTKSDRETFTNLISGKVDDDTSLRIIKNFQFFKQKIDESKLDVATIFRGIQKLFIVDIALEESVDNPQLIFESLNSTGLDLSPADLIRNYILMGLDTSEQEKMYDTYWKPMEQSFTSEGDSSWYFNKFIKDYLTIKNNEVPVEREIYSKFKEYVQSQNMGVKEIIEDIYNKSKIFFKIAFEKFDDPKINEKIKGINDLDQLVSYPFLMKIYIDFENSLISSEELLKIYSLVESFVFRRLICDINPNILNKTFPVIISEIDTENYLESVKIALVQLKRKMRFPANEEFSEHFVQDEIYNYRGYRVDYLFDKLENFGSEEHVETDNLTIEHIMPQNPDLIEEWRKDLGPNWKEIQEKYLHTVGNLTKTGYNSTLSDRSFQEKKNTKNGFNDSPLRLNHQYLAKLDTWNEDEIKKRANVLLARSLDIWKYPDVSKEVLEQIVKEDEVGIDDDDENEDDVFEIRLSKVKPELRNQIKSIIENIENNYDCISEPIKQWLHFYIKSPVSQKTRFVGIRCGHKTSMVSIRINPENFEETKNTRKIIGYWFPKGTERRIKVNENTLDEISELVKSSYDRTLKIQDEN